MTRPARDPGTSAPARFRGTRRTALGSSIVIGLCLTMVGSGLPGHAGPPPGVAGAPEFPGSGSGAAAPSSVTVTLLTGDRVNLRETADGRTATVVTPAPRVDGPVPHFDVTQRDGHVYVVPSDVAALVPNRLDAELFNVSGLAEQGFDDAGSDTLPVILDYADDRPATLRGVQVPATEPTRELTSITAVAAQTDKAQAAELGTALRELAGAQAQPSVAGTPAAATTTGPLAGIEKVWLDGLVEAELDRSTAQVGAPTAWAAGLDGSGVTVAVLDSGIDATHPDLAGKVRAAANFTAESESRDVLGHGTHVASIVAGTGTASDGARRGVAPGAELLDGRVLDSYGQGLTSWIIAGMEWAAAQDADVVNLSLSAFPGSPEGPIITEAVERLSAETGTLFVAAAGNLGCDACIASPGAAPSALTVGAVDRDDTLAEFSSRGPAYGGHGLKPDLTAPGVGIVAARAKDAALGGEGDYLALDGTSMAAPHVAGAAALLSQARPDLDASGLKATLVATTQPIDGGSLYEQGAGRLDVAAAVTGPVIVDHESLDLGFFAWPQAEVPPQTREISYRNVGDEPVTLELAAVVSDADGRPTEALGISPATLTVPAGGTGSATLTLDLAGAAPGIYTGQVEATGADGLRLHSPVGYAIEEEQFELTLSAIARDGRPARPWGNSAGSLVTDVETGEPMYQPCTTPPAGLDFCVRVPAGTYSALAYVYTKPAWAESDGDRYTTTPLHVSLVGDPELTISGDRRLVLDAREAVEVEVDTPDRDATANVGGAADLSWSRTAESGVTTVDSLVNYPGSQLEERFFVQPMVDVSVGDLVTTSRWRLEEPALTLDVRGSRVELTPRYYRMDWFSDNSWQYPMLDGRRRLPVVDAGDGSAEAVAAADLRGALALIRRTDDIPVAEQANRAAAAGAALVAIYNDEPGRSDVAGPPGTALQVPTVGVPHEEGVALLALMDSRRSVTVTAEGTPSSSYLYELVFAEREGVPSDLHYRVDRRDLAEVDRRLLTQPGEQSYSDVSWPFEEGAEFATGHLFPVWSAPSERTDYYLVDPKTSWEHGVWTPQAPYNYIWPHPDVESLRLESPMTTYRRAGRTETAWFGQPLAPGFDPDRPVTRAGDVLTIPTAGLVDSGRNFGEAWSPSTQEGFASMFRVWLGDDVLGETDREPQGTILLPPDQQTYRITYDIANNAPWAALGTRTSAEWTFASAHVDSDAPQDVPLLHVAYDLPTNLDNVLRHDRRVGLTITGSPERIREVGVEVSYDDGRTWHDARVGGSRGSYSVDLPRAPRGADHLSLRTSARDATGNAVTQEIIRAALLP